jgi:hypothetical protein
LKLLDTFDQIEEDAVDITNVWSMFIWTIFFVEYIVVKMAFQFHLSIVESFFYDDSI